MIVGTCKNFVMLTGDSIICDDFKFGEKRVDGYNAQCGNCEYFDVIRRVDE